MMFSPAALHERLTKTVQLLFLWSAIHRGIDISAARYSLLNCFPGELGLSFLMDVELSKFNAGFHVPSDDYVNCLVTMGPTA